ncbi:VanW family protein, partial [Patescibacteria group bacterium]|nr:VanW family protein [Patescibacteria group bacterium]
MQLKKVLIISAPIIILGVPFAILGAFYLCFLTKIYPNTFVTNTINVSAQTVKQAEEKIKQALENKNTITLSFPKGNTVIKETVSFENINLAYQADKTAQKAFRESRINLSSRFKKKKNILTEFTLDYDLLLEKLIILGSQIHTDEIPAQISFDPDTNQVEINQGKVGKEIDLQASEEIVIESIRQGQTDQATELAVSDIGQILSEQNLADLKTRANKLINKTITLTNDHSNFVIQQEQLINFVGITQTWDGEKIKQYVDTLATSIDKPAKDALLRFEDGKVITFQPDEPGFELDQEAAIQAIRDSLNTLTTTNQTSIVKEIEISQVNPKVKTSETNKLGIKTLIGKGESWFPHSILSRIHNVDLSSSKLGGILIEPGETFSLDIALGEVSKATGYEAAYIIQDGRTVLGAGGGVCQISTTMFRAALNSGLPIVERHPHAYRVSYYEEGSKPGFVVVTSPSDKNYRQEIKIDTIL